MIYSPKLSSKLLQPHPSPWMIAAAVLPYFSPRWTSQAPSGMFDRHPQDIEKPPWWPFFILHATNIPMLFKFRKEYICFKPPKHKFNSLSRTQVHGSEPHCPTACCHPAPNLHPFRPSVPSLIRDERASHRFCGRYWWASSPSTLSDATRRFSLFLNVPNPLTPASYEVSCRPMPFFAQKQPHRSTQCLQFRQSQLLLRKKIPKIKVVCPQSWFLV